MLAVAAFGWYIMATTGEIELAVMGAFGALFFLIYVLFVIAQFGR